MLRRKTGLWLTVAAMLIGAGVWALNHDWYAYGDAAPPVPPAVVTDGEVRLAELHVQLLDQKGEVTAVLADVVPAGARLQLTGKVNLTIEDWWWGVSDSGIRFSDSRAVRKYLQAQALKPVPRTRFELLCRSFLHPGEIVAANGPFSLRRPKDGFAVFRAPMIAPERCGEYELRLTFGEAKINQLGDWSHQRVLASRTLRVVPAEAKFNAPASPAPKPD